MDIGLIIVLAIMFIIIAFINNFNETKNKLELTQLRLGEMTKKYNDINDDFEKIKKDLDFYEKDIMNKLEIKQDKLDKEKEKFEVEKKVKEILFKERFMAFPWLAKAYADFIALEVEKKEKTLRNKRNPAKKAAEQISEIKNQLKESEYNLKKLVYTIEYYEGIFPNLKNFIAKDESEIMPVNNYKYRNKDNSGDPISNYLTKEEYYELTEEDRNQRSLDNYNKRKKNNVDIGRDYERYCGYIWESKGYEVEYKGIVDGFEDMGRDLIAKKSNETHIIQCKYWSEWKEIHEKHIFQLFGTTIEYCLTKGVIKSNPENIYDFIELLKEKKIKSVFITKTKLSEKALKIAKKLQIEVKENYRIEEYPMIKCHLKGKDKIYHLPMDLQYDKIKIDGKNTFYVETVRQAINKGCRRSYKWRG